MQTYIGNGLVERHIRLVTKAASQRDRFRRTYDERYSIGCEALLNAANTHDPTRGESFSAHFFRHFSAKLIDAYRRDHNPRNTVSMDELLTDAKDDDESTLHDILPNAEPDMLDEIIKRETLQSLWRAMDKLPPLEKQVLRMRYVVNGGMTLDEIASRIGKTNQWASKVECRALKLCRKMMEC